MRALLLALLLVTPIASAALAPPDIFVLAPDGFVLARATYDDGLASTRFGFTQLSGADATATHRLVAGANCTEWDGRFTAIYVDARVASHAASASLTLVGAIAQTGAATRAEPGFELDLLAPPGGIAGTLLVCDNPAGPGSVTFTGSPTHQAPSPVGALTARITPEGSY